MEKKINIEYFKKRCIGQGSCVAFADSFFTLSGDKAELLGSNESRDGVYELEVNCDELMLQKIINAGNSCPANAITVKNTQTNEVLVSNQVNKDLAKEVIAEYDDAKEFVLDDKGYFLIRINQENKNIEVGFCDSKNKVILKVVGKKPIDIYSTILNKEKLQIRRDHAAYLGRELQKAYIALNQNLNYVQDDELIFN